jgi:hypothetical protein
VTPAAEASSIGLASMTFYIKYPEFKLLFIAVMVLMAISFVYFLWWAWRWQTKEAAGRRLSIVRNPTELLFAEAFRHVVGTCCDRTVHRHCSRRPGRAACWSVELVAISSGEKRYLNK